MTMLQPISSHRLDLKKRRRRIRIIKSKTPVIGIVEWFRPGEYKRVEQVLSDIKSIGVNELRTCISWADWHTPIAEAWYSWLLPKIASEVNILPCFTYTPPSIGIAPKVSSPPAKAKDYADFIDLMITRFGEHFEWIELWNEPNNMREWDATMDPDWSIFAEMIGGAAYWAHQRKKKTVLGGMSPIDPNWLYKMVELGVVDHIDAVGIHGFPDTFEYCWDGWRTNIEKVQEVLDQAGSKAEIWVTEAGFSTWRHDERQQLSEFIDVIQSPAKRVYWYAAHDLDPDLPTVDGFHSDEREYHFGLKRADGSAKLLFRLWSTGGLDAIKEHTWLHNPPKLSSGKDPPVLITGGAGFIGTNLASKLLESGRKVLIYNNLSRSGVERNIQWLRDIYGDRVQIEVADVRDQFTLRDAVQKASQVFHFAAQVAVTTSVVEPIHDFEVNVRGTLNVLEALRSLDNPPPLLFTSTNKVYGGLDDIKMQRDTTRYEPVDLNIRNRGVSEVRNLDFHSPYGCSKGSADQYVLDYARIYGLKAVVFRMSCIYGPHQFGTEDQGWVAHFINRAINNDPIIIYGDGMQVRDLLYIDDLLDAFLAAQARMEKISGQAFNIGGGPENSISVVELLNMISELHSSKPYVEFNEWRPGDQKYYVSDISKFKHETCWTPKIRPVQGVNLLYKWLIEDKISNNTQIAVGG